MRIAVFLGHPAHFYFYRAIIDGLKRKGHFVSIVLKRKDILEELVSNAGYEYIIIREGRTSSIVGQFLSVIKMEYEIVRSIRKMKIELLVGSTLSFAARYIAVIPVIVNGEDDAEVVPRFANLVYPAASLIVSPKSCNNGKWEHKSVKYPGFQKLAYLHPMYFQPDKSVVEQYLSADEPYFLLRFAGLSAHHDSGIKGLSDEMAMLLVEKLKKKGNVLISSERLLPLDLENLKLKINPLDIHHIMAFATMYIGDSQSMAVEAAMLGVPSIRFNDFAGKIGVLNELESVYDLTVGIPSTNPDALFQKVDEWLNNVNLRSEFAIRRQVMLGKTIDVTAFFVWLIENYPNSKDICQNNPDFCWKYK